VREDHQAAGSLGQDQVGREGHAADVQAKLYRAIFAALAAASSAHIRRRGEVFRGKRCCLDGGQAGAVTAQRGPRGWWTMPAVARPVVCVIGAGTAGLEGILAARAELGAEAELRLIAPESEFRYRPMSSSSLFRPAREGGLAIGDLAAQAGARWVADRADVVDEAERGVLTRDGDTVDFDFLLVAAGARFRPAVRQGHVWERGADPSFLDQTILAIAAGEVRSVAVAVPRGARWPLPAYELALVLAWSASGSDARVTLITAEEQPLAALGREATDAVTRELGEAGVETIAGVELVDEPSQDRRAGERAKVILMPEEPAAEADALIGKPTDPARVRLGSGSAVEFDRLISLPTVRGPFIAGVATDAAGFVEVDQTLSVCGSKRVWAAGGCIASALEVSALGARQADAAIAAIAIASNGSNGAGAGTPPTAPDLIGVLMTGLRDQWLAENPVGTPQPSTRCMWWPPGRAVGHTLAQHIAAWDPAVQQALPSLPGGVLVRVPVALSCSERPSVRPGAHINPEEQLARLRDIENRQLMAVRQRERAADAELRALSAGLETLRAHEQGVVKELQRHGYLHGHG
jgi:sulfide:quinone oxidoreductase